MIRRMFASGASAVVLATMLSVAPAGAVASFGDVDDGRYFTNGVQWMVDTGVTNGTSPTCFSPSDLVTRGQAVAFLWRMEGQPTAPAHGFVDVTRDWQQGPVSWAQHTGITQGTGAGTFSPDRAVTRGEFAALLFRLAGEPPTSVDHGFGDVTRDWQQAPVSWLVDQAITTGTSAETFSPDQEVSRGQVATFLYRYQGNPPVTVDSTHPRTPHCAGQVQGPTRTTGYQSLFIGHSFFAPVARDIGTYAQQAGFVDHQQDVVFSGGATGSPQALWENAVKRTEIQEVLDGGDVDLFGMTYHPDYPTLTGYRNWIEYALAQNPDTVFFVAVPWQTNPPSVDAVSYRDSWRSIHVAIGHDLLDELRLEYSGLKIFEIPYGQAAGELYVRFAEGQLPELTTLVGGGPDALFRDSFGHAGPMIIDLAGLVWLRAIYGVPLWSFPFDGGYVTDLPAIAAAILDQHDPEYDWP